jgi:hypothetical protein
LFHEYYYIDEQRVTSRTVGIRIAVIICFLVIAAKLEKKTMYHLFKAVQFVQLRGVVSKLSDDYPYRKEKN